MIEMNLDESIIRQMGIEPTEGTSVEFDAKGTMHIVDRDKEGALIKDSPITGEVKHSRVSDYQEIMDEYESMKRKNSAMRVKFQMVTAGIVVAVVFVLVFIGVVLSM